MLKKSPESVDQGETTNLSFGFSLGKAKVNLWARTLLCFRIKEKRRSLKYPQERAKSMGRIISRKSEKASKFLAC